MYEDDMRLGGTAKETLRAGGYSSPVDKAIEPNIMARLNYLEKHFNEYKENTNQRLEECLLMIQKLANVIGVDGRNR